MAEGYSNAVSVAILGAILLIGAGVSVSIGAQVSNTIAVNSLTNGVAVTNQSLTFTNNTQHVLSGSSVSSITFLGNATQSYSSGNFTLTSGQDGSSLLIIISCGGPGIAGSGNCTGVGSTLNVSYVANQKNTASLTASNTTSGLAQLATQFPNIGLVIGVSVILTIIFGIIFATMGRGRRE